MEIKRNKMSFYKSIIKKMSKDKTKKSEVYSVVDVKTEDRCNCQKRCCRTERGKGLQE